jgi:Cu-Zn family superoxide dismutase
MGNSNSNSNIINAVCVINSDKIKATIRFSEYHDNVVIYGKVSGLAPNKMHAIHIHEYGDMTDGCTSSCAHYNPYNMKHGGPKSKERHVGDMGNIAADSEGNCVFIISDHLVKLNGPHNVIGRAVVIHEDSDDYGLGGHDDSLTTGHAGKRIGCGVIGISSDKINLFSYNK